MLAKSIPIQSLCEHHLLPFRGIAHVGYLPGERILGLSKLARVVELFARDLQVQERLTQQVADALDKHLSPKGVGVVIEAEHLCMSLRGVRATGSRTVTRGGEEREGGPMVDVTIQTGHGDLPAYLATPSTPGPWPGVIVITTRWVGARMCATRLNG